MIKIIEKQIEDVAVCTIEGKLAGLDGKGKIQEKVHDLIENKIVKVILDLAKVNWIDSTGLGELIASLSSAKNKDGNLVLANLQDPVQSLLKMTNLDEIFETYENVELALEKLKK
ncbi:MAG: STAS domain-containing protein [bacterium]